MNIETLKRAKELQEELDAVKTTIAALNSPDSELAMKVIEIDSKLPDGMISGRNLLLSEANRRAEELQREFERL